MNNPDAELQPIRITVHVVSQIQRCARFVTGSAAIQALPNVIVLLELTANFFI
jgi:hypothetical protein